LCISRISSTCICRISERICSLCNVWIWCLCICRIWISSLSICLVIKRLLSISRISSTCLVSCRIRISCLSYKWIACLVSKWISSLCSSIGNIWLLVLSCKRISSPCNIRLLNCWSKYVRLLKDINVLEGYIDFRFILRSSTNCRSSRCILYLRSTT